MNWVLFVLGVASRKTLTDSFWEKRENGGWRDVKFNVHLMRAVFS